ncbi:MAG: hypothetical protein FVQ77_03300 [Cytophagales bacterium]|nr:hypothetical protein [Cytophagales bacterium]
MKKLTLLLLSLQTCTVDGFTQPVKDCAVKIGSNYYINCKHIIVFQQQDVLTVTDTKGNSIKINFDIFSPNGKKVAAVKDGQLVEGNKDLYDIKSSDKEYTFMEKSTNRIICYVKRTFNKEKNRCELQIWADMYMPSGFYFQCTPETTNVPLLNMMKGSTFTGAESAIILN